MAGLVYALVVGIDEYPDPRHRLSGCVNDANAVSAYLESQIPKEKLSLMLLLNDQATRQAIVDGFRQHLSTAEVGDTAMFFYAGHGSQERAPEEFWKIEPDRLDETLVCWDSRTPDHWDLADKELALLLNEVAARQPHLVVVLDCCHSGSGTRAAAFGDVVRRFPTDARERPAAQFLPGVLEVAERAISGDSGWTSAPSARHVLLAACRDDQEAKECSGGGQRHGAFTWFLLDALQNGGAGATYRELHKHAKALIEANIAAQTPQLEAMDDQDLDRPFLGGEIRSQQGIYTAHQRADGTWVVDGGRVHGIAAPEGQERTELAFFANGTPPAAMTSVKAAIARGHVTSVGTSESVLAIDTGNLTPCTTYRAIVVGLPLPLAKVRFEGDAAGVTLLDQALSTASPAGGTSTYVAAAASGEDLRVNSVSGRYELTRVGDGRPITAPIAGFTADSARAAIRALEHVARWTRVSALQNSSIQLKRSDVALEFYSGSTSETPVAESEIELRYQRDTAGKQKGPTFRVKLKNSSDRTLYCGLIGLSQMYGVTNLFPEGTLALTPGQEAWVNGGKPLYSNIPKQLVAVGVTECTDVLKLIAGTSDFDVRLLTQPDIDQPYTRSVTRSAATRKGTLNRIFERVHTRGLSAEPQDDEEVDDFLTIALAIRTVRPRDVAEISAAAPATLDANVVIAPHAGLRGNARLTSVGEVGRDIGSHVEPPMFRDQPGAVVPLQFTATRGSDQGLSALELLDLINPESVTAEAPLKVMLPIVLQENEAVLPLAHDGEFFLPVDTRWKGLTAPRSKSCGCRRSKGDVLWRAPFASSFTSSC